MGTTEILGMDLPPEEKLRLFVRNHIKNIIIKSLPMFSVFFSEENQLQEKDYQKIRKEKRKYNRILEEIIEEGVSKGVFKKVDAKLQSYAILGMCNWIYKWYKEGQTEYTSDQISDHFISLLEKGILKNELLESGENFEVSTLPNTKNKSKVSKQILFELKRKCTDLIKLIEKAEKSL
jgi:hemerythrin